MKILKNLVILVCLWILKKLSANPEIPHTVFAYEAPLRMLIREEMPLNHGSVDVLGDSWLKFRRVATKMKKAYPHIPIRDLFRAIIVIHEQEEDVQA